jgi:hypothetical protein
VRPKRIFLKMEIMFSTFNTLADTAISMILRGNRKPVELLKQLWEFFSSTDRGKHF